MLGSLALCQNLNLCIYFRLFLCAGDYQRRRPQLHNSIVLICGVLQYNSMYSICAFNTESGRLRLNPEGGDDSWTIGIIFILCGTKPQKYRLINWIQCRKSIFICGFTELSFSAEGAEGGSLIR
jgi:hypothetical protein